MSGATDITFTVVIVSVMTTIIMMINTGLSRNVEVRGYFSVHLGTPSWFRVQSSIYP